MWWSIAPSVHSPSRGICCGGEHHEHVIPHVPLSVGYIYAYAWWYLQDGGTYEQQCVYTSHSLRVWCVAPAALMVCTTCGVLSVWHVVPPAGTRRMCIPSVHTPSWHLLCVDVVHEHSHTHSVAHVGACTCSTMDVGCSGTWYVHVDVCVENTLTDAPHIHLMTAFTPSVGVCVPPSTSCTYHSQDGAGSGRMYRWM